MPIEKCVVLESTLITITSCCLPVRKEMFSVLLTAGCLEEWVRREPPHLLPQVYFLPSYNLQILQTWGAPIPTNVLSFFIARFHLKWCNTDDSALHFFIHRAMIWMIQKASLLSSKEPKYPLSSLIFWTFQTKESSEREQPVLFCFVCHSQHTEISGSLEQ